MNCLGPRWRCHGTREPENNRSFLHEEGLGGAKFTLLQAFYRSNGAYLRYRDKLTKPDVLILDDMGMRKMSSNKAQDLCEILAERSIAKSTVFTTQLPLDHWSEVIADPVIADAIRDRLQHSALTISITGESYRGANARKLASKKKNA